MRILLGGSPCTHWSIAKKERETTSSGQGWELFLNYKIALDKFKPDYFLYENVASMSKDIKEEITKTLGVAPILINSALVSAQQRKRLYWTNIPNVSQPADLGIMLQEILESGVDVQEKAYCLTASYYKASVENTLKKHQRTMSAELVQRLDYMRPLRVKEGTKKGFTEINIGECVDLTQPNSKTRRGRRMAEKSNCTCTSNEFYEYLGVLNDSVYKVKNGQITIKNKTYPIRLVDGFYIIRKLTVEECKKLQTVPDAYIMPCSKTQNYKMLGNGWTVKVISHILSHIPDLQEQELEILSMYDGMSCGQIALHELNANIKSYTAYEIDKYAIQTTQTNFPQTIQRGDAFQIREEKDI